MKVNYTNTVCHFFFFFPLSTLEGLWRDFAEQPQLLMAKMSLRKSRCLAVASRAFNQEQQKDVHTL